MSGRAASGGIAVAALLTAAGVALLVGLGVWQIERRAWKHELIARLGERLAAPPVRLPAPSEWGRLSQAADEFRRVTVTAVFPSREEAHVYTTGSALRSDVSGVGYWVMAPGTVEGGGTVLINRGFVSEMNRDSHGTRVESPGPVQIAGVLRWPEERSLFTPPAQPTKNLWFAREPQIIADAKGWGKVAPFYIEQETPNPGGAPKAGRIEPRLSDSHLQYALTWFALATGLAAVFAVWLRGRGRQAPAN